MNPSTKRTVMLIGGIFAGLLVLVPAGLWLWMWLSFRSYRIARQLEATRAVADFHQRFNAHDLDAICRNAYKCGELPNLKQDWQSVLEDARNRGGAFKRVLRSDIQVSVEPPSVRADVVSLFEKGELRELFVLNDFDGPLKITTYGTVFKPQ
jgi:hypothetical protein